MNATKEQVIEMVQSVDGLLISTNAGEGFVKGWDKCIEFASQLLNYCFCGEVAKNKIPKDIIESPYYEPDWATFKFSSSGMPDGDIYINI